MLNEHQNLKIRVHQPYLMLLFLLNVLPDVEVQDYLLEEIDLGEIDLLVMIVIVMESSIKLIDRLREFLGATILKLSSSD